MARTLAEEIRAAREARGLTLRQLHRDSGVGLSYLSRLERGEARRPGPPVLAAIARATEQGRYGDLMRAAGYL